MIQKNTVYFVGSGPGDPELITIKAKNLLENADVIIYSGSLLNPELLRYAKRDAQLHDAAKLDRLEIYEILKDSTRKGKLAIRFHDGDPAIFSTIREQIDRLEKDEIECSVIPGITSLLGAAASMNLEFTLPGITQTIIITRAEFRTPVPDRERISELSKHGSTMAFYLSVHLLERIIEELLKGGVYTNDTPVAIIYKATWKDQKILKGTLGTITKKVKEERIVKTALIVVGDVIAPKKYEFSKVYDSQFTHGYRKSKESNRALN
jgi:precorrin-4/cobalt-precorrin-4 C11-methyltransferase